MVWISGFSYVGCIYLSMCLYLLILGLFIPAEIVSVPSVG